MGRVGEKEPAEGRLSGCVADEMAKLCSRGFVYSAAGKAGIRKVVDAAGSGSNRMWLVGTNTSWQCQASQ